MGSLNQIEHVVVLMLENRSFDNMLGRLYPRSAEFDGLTLTESNPAPDGTVIPVWNVAGTDPDPFDVGLRRQLPAADGRAGGELCRPERHALFQPRAGAGDQSARTAIRRLRS